MPVINSIAIFLSLGAFLLVFHFVQKGYFRERYALIWLISGVLAVGITASPGLMRWVCYWLDVEVVLNLLLFLAVIFLASISMMLTAVVSRQAVKIEILAKEMALLHKVGHSKD